MILKTHIHFKNSIYAQIWQGVCLWFPGMAGLPHGEQGTRAEST